MLDLLYQISDATVFLLMILITVSFSWLFVLLNKVFKLYKLSADNNATTASIAALLGIIYGVLTGFLCLYLLNNQDHSINAALSEGTAADNIYRESKWLKDPLKTEIQSELKEYINNVINIEWPLMSQGKAIDSKNHLLIYKISNQLMNYEGHSQTEMSVINNLSQDLNTLSKSRQERIQMSSNQLSDNIWVVVFLSTFLIIIINYAFHVNYKLHLFYLTAFAIMAASMLFLLITLDRPFQGEFIVEPDALNRVLDVMALEKSN